MDLFSADLPEQGDQPAGVATSAGTSHEPDGAVRSWPDAGDTATEGGGAGASARRGTRSQGAGLSAMLLPELQRVAQSEGITGTAKMRKGQLIAAIEERRQGGEPRTALQTQTSDNSVQRKAPAGAGADRTFEQDAMESQTSTQPGLGGAAAGGIGEGPVGSEGGIGGAHAASEVVTAGNGAPAGGGVTAGPAGDEAQQAGDGQRGDRRRRNPRRDDGGDQARGASDDDGREQNREGGRDQGGRDGGSGGREQGGRDQGGPGSGRPGDLRVRKGVIWVWAGRNYRGVTWRFPPGGKIVEEIS